MKFWNILSSVGLLILGIFLLAVRTFFEVILPVAIVMIIVMAVCMAVTSFIWLPILLIFAL